MDITPSHSIRLTPILRIGVVCIVAGSTMTISGCGGSDSPSVRASMTRAPADTRVEYTVRGRVMQLPGGPEHPAREFMVHHEAIPEFRSSMAPGDERMGMMSMTMAFPLSEGVSLAGISVGDPIEMMFEAAYDAGSGRLMGYEVRRLTLLSPETNLDITEDKPQLL